MVYRVSLIPAWGTGMVRSREVITFLPAPFMVEGSSASTAISRVRKCFMFALYIWLENQLMCNTLVNDIFRMIEQLPVIGS